MNGDDFQKAVSHSYPHTLTILCTYKCTAACEQCCFESSPMIKGRLSLNVIKKRINEAHSNFQALKLVVFSGGEAFLLKDDLFAAVNYATSLGLMTRIVTNAYWGRNTQKALDTAHRLKNSGISEINISTGADHEKWVPISSVIHAARALTSKKIRTVITVEAETERSRCFDRLIDSEDIKYSITSGFLSIQRNSWMKFNEKGQDRINLPDVDALRKGCDQIFSSIVVTPHDNISACCGLTLEHIPEMRIGSTKDSLNDAYSSSYQDFLKFWIHLDGPYRIIERLNLDNKDILKNVNHICEACIRMHQNSDVKDKLMNDYQDFLPEIMARFSLKSSLLKRNATGS